MFECGGMAFIKAGFRVFRCGSKVRAFGIHHSWSSYIRTTETEPAQWLSAESCPISEIP